MKIKDLLEQLDTLNEKDRVLWVTQLCILLTPVSIKTLQSFQNQWEGGTYEEFVKAQNVVIRECVQIETTPFGEDVRGVMGFEPLSLETEINYGRQ